MPYTFSDDYRYKKLTLRCIKNIHGLQIPISDNIFFKHCGGYCRYGLCSVQDHPIEPRFVISVNRYFLTEKDAEETIVHELLHTACPTMKHAGLWNQFAELCSDTLHLHISRAADRPLQKQAYKNRRIFQMEEDAPGNAVTIECPRCRQKAKVIPSLVYADGSTDYVCPRCNKYLYARLPDSDAKNLSDAERHVLVQRIINLSEFDAEYIYSLLPYIPQNDVDRLFLHLRIKHPEKFMDFRSMPPALRLLNALVSKKAKHHLADKVCDGYFDSLPWSYSAWITFSGVFCMTADYIRCEEHMRSIHKFRLKV